MQSSRAHQCTHLGHRHCSCSLMLLQVGKLFFSCFVLLTMFFFSNEICTFDVGHLRHCTASDGMRVCALPPMWMQFSSHPFSLLARYIISRNASAFAMWWGELVVPTRSFADCGHFSIFSHQQCTANATVTPATHVGTEKYNEINTVGSEYRAV